jgi:hypothetical protein
MTTYLHSTNFCSYYLTFAKFIWSHYTTMYDSLSRFDAYWLHTLTLHLPFQLNWDINKPQQKKWSKQSPSNGDCNMYPQILITNHRPKNICQGIQICSFILNITNYLIKKLIFFKQNLKLMDKTFKNIYCHTIWLLIHIVKEF